MAFKSIRQKSVSYDSEGEWYDTLLWNIEVAEALKSEGIRNQTKN